MKWIPDETMKALYEALDAFGAEPGDNAFGRYWKTVGPVEDYAAVADTASQQLLVQLLRWILERELWKSARYEFLHPEAQGVEEFLGYPQRPHIE